MEEYMLRSLVIFLMVSAAYGQTVLDESDENLEPEHVKAMMKAVLDDLDSSTAYFSSLSYKETADGEDRDVVCGIVSHGGDYGFYFSISETDATILPRQMGRGGRDLLVQQLGEIGCSLP